MAEAFNPTDQASLDGYWHVRLTEAGFVEVRDFERLGGVVHVLIPPKNAEVLLGWLVNWKRDSDLKLAAAAAEKLVKIPVRYVPPGGD